MYWLGKFFDPLTLTYISRCSDFDAFYVDVWYLLNYKSYNHHTLRSASPWCTDFAGTLIRWPWPTFRAPVTDTFYADVWCIPNYKTYNHQTLHSASSRCTDLADILTRWPWHASPRCTDLLSTLTVWPWPIFCAPVTLTHFTSTFDISQSIRPTTTKPCIEPFRNV